MPEDRPDPDKDERIRELSERIGQLEEALREVARPYSELSRHIAQFQEMVNKYFRLLDLYQKHGSISIDLILPQVKDPISREILRILLEKERLNISQITEELRARTGSASRRIVRERLARLAEEGVLVEVKGTRSKSYEISGSVIGKWSEVLGFS